ncbi:hypothetical protein HQ29_01620 [Porphyromonas canoris]|nr:hypothetical protein HQ29_01620 [Porphyromonas canoris]
MRPLSYGIQHKLSPLKVLIQKYKKKKEERYMFGIIAKNCVSLTPEIFPIQQIQYQSNTK